MHVCNVKKFMVYGGLSEENMIELIERFAQHLLFAGPLCKWFTEINDAYSSVILDLWNLSIIDFAFMHLFAFYYTDQATSFVNNGSISCLLYVFFG